MKLGLKAVDLLGSVNGVEKQSMVSWELSVLYRRLCATAWSTFFGASIITPTNEKKE